MAAVIHQFGAHVGSRVAKSSFYLTVTTLVGSVLGFVFWLIAARLYSPEDLGLGAAYLSATVLVAAWADLGLSTTIVRFGAGPKERLVSLLNSAVTVVIIAGALLALVTAVVAGNWAEELSSLSTALPLIAFATAASSLSAAQLIDRVFVALEASQFTTARVILSGVIRIGAIIVFGAQLGPVAVLWAVTLGSAVGVMGAALWTSRLVPQYAPRPELRMAVLRRVFSYSAVSHVGNLLWSAPRLVYPLLVVAWLGTSANSAFYVAWMVANLLLIVPSATSSALLARWSSESPGDTRPLIRAALALTVLLAPAVALMALGTPVLLALFGPSYAGSSSYVGPLLLSAFPFGINSLALAFHRAVSGSRWTILIPAFVAMFCIVAAALLAPTFGVYGVSMGWLVGQSLGVLVVLASLQRRFGSQWRVAG